MKDVILYCFILCFYLDIGAVLCSKEDKNAADQWNESSSQEIMGHLVVLKDKEPTNPEDEGDCWLKLKAPELFRVMKKLDRRYLAARMRVQSYIDTNDFDSNMLKTMLTNRGAAYREITKEKINHAKIPAGMNLGGMCMVRLPDCVLFFHRMKLRNNTFFRINELQNDIKNMMLKMHLSLNDLHLMGAYERTMTDRDPSALIYAPSFGELEILLKDVQYDVEGRYRLIKDRLVVELIISELHPQDIILTHMNGTTDHTMRIQKDNLGDFMARLKTDLNEWVQDYLNDYLIYINLDQVPDINTLQKYDKEKAAQLAVFMDNAIIMIRKKIRAIGATSIRVPKFTIVAAHGLKIKIFDGALQGLDTMYRRSVATTMLKREDFRYVNGIIGFSDLKVVYKYEISFPSGSPAPPSLTGLIILSANDVTSHLALGLLRDPEVVELDIDFMNLPGPNSLTVEGAANLLISNFKHLLKLQILTIMSNSLIYGVGMLRSLPRCQPFVPGQLKKRQFRHIVKIARQKQPMPEIGINDWLAEGKVNTLNYDDNSFRKELRRPRNKTHTPKYPFTKKNITM